MEQISNKSLTLLLLIAIIVSVIGTIVSINRLNQLIPKITGLGTTTTGMVNVTIAAVTSISATDTQIDFGSCSPNATTGTNLSSNVSTDWGAPGVCSSIPNTPDNITIKNDGNKNINVSVQTNVLPSTFIGGTDPHGPEMYFSVRNSSDTPGCFNVTGWNTTGASGGFDPTLGMQYVWRNMSATATEYLACLNLTPAKSFYLFAKLFIPADALVKTDTNATLTFTAASW